MQILDDRNIDQIRPTVLDSTIRDAVPRSPLPMPTDQTPVTSLSSASVINSVGQAWNEVGAVAESLSRSPHSTFKRFFPTDFPGCHAPIDAAIAEYLKTNPAVNTSQFKTGGYVFFPGKSMVGESFTMVIPLHIVGEVQIEDLHLDEKHHYHIPKPCYIDVSEGAKLVALIVDSK